MYRSINFTFLLQARGRKENFIRISRRLEQVDFMVRGSRQHYWYSTGTRE